MIASSGRGKAAICCNAKCCNGPGFANVFMALRQWEPSYPSAPFMQVPCHYYCSRRGGTEPEPSSGTDAADAQVAPQRLERTEAPGARRSSLQVRGLGSLRLAGFVVLSPKPPFERNNISGLSSCRRYSNFFHPPSAWSDAAPSGLVRRKASSGRLPR